MKKTMMLAMAAVWMAAAAQGAVQTLAEDSAANYTAETFAAGANGGSGFGAWDFWNAAPSLADSTVGGTGACGDVNSENGLSFRFARTADNEWCNGYRGFSAPMQAGDRLSFRFTCAWCGGGRGLDLFFGGGRGDEDKINLIHLSGDNEFSVNGTVISTEWAPNAVTEVEIEQGEGAVTLHLTRTSPEAAALDYTTNVAKSATLTGIGLYAGGWEWAEDTVGNYAFYVNDLKIEGEPASDALRLDGGWAVTNAEQEIAFTVSRTGSAGALEVALTSGNPAFADVSASSVTIADGETTAAFTVSAKLQGSGDEATIRATAEGCGAGEYTVRGPAYRMSVADDTWQLGEGETVQIWVNNDEAEGSPFHGIDEEKVTLETSDGEVLTVSKASEWSAAEVGRYTSATVTGGWAGTAALLVKYDGVTMCRWDFTVEGPAEALVTLDARRVIRVGTETWLTVTAKEGAGEQLSVATSDGAVLGVDPQVLAPKYEDGEATAEVKLTGTGAGTATVTVQGAGGRATWMVEVRENPDYSGYLSYDEAAQPSYYGGFTTEPAGLGTTGFGEWSASYAGTSAALVTGETPEGLEGLAGDAQEGVAFALSASAAEEYPRSATVWRSLFAGGAALGAGQRFAVDLGVDWRNGYKGVKLLNESEGNLYRRFEFGVHSDNYWVGLDGVEGDIDLGWAWTGARTVRVECALNGEGSEYTFTLTSGSDRWSTNVATADGYWWAGIHAVQLEVNGTEDGRPENRLYFNGMSVTQDRAEGPRIEDVEFGAGSCRFAAVEGATVLYATGLTDGGWNWEAAPEGMVTEADGQWTVTYPEGAGTAVFCVGR